MIDEMIVWAMEWIGTIAFAISGSLVAIGCCLDLFGVITVGCLTAVGGGIVRDLLIGKIPPQIFFSPQILLVSLITSVLVFIIAYLNRNKFDSFRKRTENINIFFDALGLAAFSVAGVEIACTAGYSEQGVLAVTLGVLTGIGGGVLRDVLVNEKPYVLTKHIYAVASIGGSVIYYVVSSCLGFRVIGTFVSLTFTVLIRLLAARFRWKLPKISLEEREYKEG